MIQIYHNNRCGKSRACIAFIKESGQPFEIIDYLKDSPSFETLSAIIVKLKIKPIELVRQNEKIWLEHFKNKKLFDIQIIQAMVDYPILIERPIVINGENAVIARPFELAKTII